MPNAAVIHSTAPRTIGQNLTIAALGVVYGDIGTSPLYAVRQCFSHIAGVSEQRVFGVLSMIAWALMLVVTLKYVIVLMRADNRGEGGILALTVLALRAAGAGRSRWILGAGLFGLALFFGDGVLTPSISVLSAVEGLKVATPALEPFVLPLTLAVLIALFVLQRHGTGRVGRFFGPIIILWFATIGLLGLVEVARKPAILKALDSRYAIDLIVVDPAQAFVLLGSVVLAVTGAEALYADMGHFGPAPIRRGVGLASIAAVIASQAVISGAFSLTRQAVQLGYLPRMQVRHTSEETIGQVYVPAMNGILLVAVVVTVLGFRSSNALGGAYGIAVTGTMMVDTLLAFTFFWLAAKWPLWRLIPLFVLFLALDLSFFGANLLKIAEGGWFPLTIGGVLFAVMMTWWRGRRLLAALRARDALPLHQFVHGLNPGKLSRVPGTAIFMTRDLGHVPAALLHALKHYKVLHERVVMMQVETRDVPHVPEEQRLEIDELGKGFYTIRVHYGFMDEPNVLRALAQCRVGGLRFNLMETSFIIGRERVRPRPRRTAFWRWRDRLFSLMTNNMLDATEFFRIPPNRVVELGGQIEI